MARSLAKIHEQIAKLQKEAASIQSTVIARIKREIAQHGLTAEQLFGLGESSYGGNGLRMQVASSRGSKQSKADKPPKFADGRGNTWHGIGKRPSWIHAALADGRSLSDFLVGKAAKATPANTAKKAGNEVSQARHGRKKAAPTEKVAQAADAAKPARRSGAKKSATTLATGKKAARKLAAKKSAPAKRPVRARKTAAAVEGAAAGQLSA